MRILKTILCILICSIIPVVFCSFMYFVINENSHPVLSKISFGVFLLTIMGLVLITNADELKPEVNDE